jgi:hypothetical protein
MVGTAFSGLVVESLGIFPEMAGVAADRKGRRPPTQALRRRGGACSALIRQNRAPISYFDAFSSREPVPTLLENAMRDLRKGAE